jgi:hypothetical protein
LIVGLVLDVLDASVVSYAFLLGRPFVGGKWRVSLAGVMGENVILWVILSLSLFFALWLIVRGLEK